VINVAAIGYGPAFFGFLDVDFFLGVDFFGVAAL
jgi:hypothetical protein